MTGKGRELADILHGWKKKVSDVRARRISAGCKLLFGGVNEQDKNAVEIVVGKCWNYGVFGVERLIG